MKNQMVFALFVAGLFIGGAFVYGWMYQEIQDKTQQLQRAQQQLASRITYVPLSKVEFDVTGTTTLNYTADVNASDDVAARAWHNTTISIKNKEDSGIAHLRLALRVPGEDDGLPDDLEQEEFMVYITDGTTVHYLFGDDEWDGEYHNYDFDLSGTSSLTYTLVTSMDACNDVFEDGKTHSIEIFLWERDAGLNGQGALIDSEKLTLET